MNSLVLDELKAPLKLVEQAPLSASSGDAVVQLRAAALNRRDYWVTQGMYPGIKLGVVLGSDGAGVVSALGEGVDASWQDREVIINPGWDWGDTEASHHANFRILGMPDDGTFAGEVRVPAEYLYAKPEHLSWQEAAALPLAGVTAYRALFTQGRIASGQNVLVSGIGGGVATMALQLALAAGATVFVTSSSEDKLARATALGAAGGFKYNDDGWHKQLKAEYGPLDLIIDSAGGAGYANLLDVAGAGGRVVSYGATAGPPKQVDLFKVFWKQLHLIGSTMGSPKDFQAMLDFVNQHEVKPVVDDVYPLAEGNAALEKMRDTRQFGKIVLEIDGQE